MHNPIRGSLILLLAFMIDARTAIGGQTFQKEIALPQLVAQSWLIALAKYDGREETAEHFWIKKVLRGELESRAIHGEDPAKSRAAHPIRLAVYPAYSAERAEDEKNMRETGLSLNRFHAAFRPRTPLSLKPGSLYLVFLKTFQDGARKVYELSAVNAYLPGSEEKSVTALIAQPSATPTAAHSGESAPVPAVK